MKVYTDLHIHTDLSPCAQSEMTPNNIVRMSILKRLDIIAITDHNSGLNIEPCIKCSEGTNLLVVPGIEICTQEEIHCICLFKNLNDALEISEYVYNKLPDIKNREDIFGCQNIYDENDNIVSNLDKLLLNAAQLSIDEVWELTLEKEGVFIPAHVDRQSNSMLYTLGAIPNKINVKYLEIHDMNNIHAVRRKYNIDSKFISSSDAHDLGSILERKIYFDLEEINLDKLYNILHF